MEGEGVGFGDSSAPDTHAPLGTSVAGMLSTFVSEEELKLMTINRC